MYTSSDQTFVVFAYKENPHLEETIYSLLNQTVKSKIILSTSTPNEYIKKMCEKHQLELKINPISNGAGADWNFGYNMADTKLVTLAHQDDIYEKDFLKVTLRYLNNYNGKELLAFTDYFEYRNDAKVERNLLLQVKRIMNAPLSKTKYYSSKFLRRRILSFGCPICCPSVTYIKENVGDSPFDTKYINSCDYKTYVELAQKDGAYIYIPEKLLSHRIYPDSATSKNLGENIRKGEDLEILSEFWPKWIARFINYIYAFSEKSNNL